MAVTGQIPGHPANVGRLTRQQAAAREGQLAGRRLVG